MTVEVILPADREAWLALRQQDITASVAGAVLGEHPYTTPYRLWAEKTGRAEPDHEETEATERGELLEPVAVAMVRRRHPEWEVIYENDRAYYRDAASRIGATPDAFVRRPSRFGKGNMQIKTASEDAFKKFWLDPDTEEVVPPLWIAVQAITEAKLTGCEWACVALVVVTWRGNLKLHVVDIPLHERLWAKLVEAVGDFWAMVAVGAEPPPDWERDGDVVLDVYGDTVPDRRDLTSDPDLDELACRYRELRSAASEATRQADFLKPRIISALGNAASGFTSNWTIDGPTQHRAGSKSRPLRIKKRENYNGSF